MVYTELTSTFLLNQVATNATLTLSFCHGIFGLAFLARMLQPIMRPPRTNKFPQISFHFHASHHGSDICDCIAAIDKKAVKRYPLGNTKWVLNGQDFVDSVAPLSGNFYSDWITKESDASIKAKNSIKGIRSFHCFEINVFNIQKDPNSEEFFDIKRTDGDLKITAWRRSFDRWDISKTPSGRWRNKGKWLQPVQPHWFQLSSFLQF